MRNSFFSRDITKLMNPQIHSFQPKMSEGGNPKSTWRLPIFRLLPSSLYLLWISRLFLATFRQHILTRVGGFLNFSSFPLIFFHQPRVFLRESLRFLFKCSLRFSVSGKILRLGLSFNTQKENQVSNLWSHS